MKLLTCVLCSALLVSTGCGSPGTSLFTSCEGTLCGYSSAGGAAQGGLESVAGQFDKNGADQGAAANGADQGPAAGTGGGSVSGLAGSAGFGGAVGGAGAAGSTSAAGSPSSLSSAGSSGNPSLVPNAVRGCVPQVGALSALSLYNGADGACSLNLAPPRMGSWFGFDDGTLVPKTSSNVSAQMGGQNAGGCYVRGSGSGATDWGGGIGFALNGSSTSPCEYDATAYSGVLIYVNGSATATQGPNYQPAAGALRINVVTTATSDVYGTCTPADGKCNDHFGAWCTLGSGWERCDVPFGNLSQRGWGAVKHFDKAQILQIQLVALRDPQAEAATSWDISADDVAFYP